MQYLLSGYANWFNTRHHRSGHIFQGRFNGEMIEDEQYFWTVSRYVHLNPVRGKRPLVERPEQWHWSSYAGYRWRRKRVSWVAYDAAAWLARRVTTATLRELSSPLGLGRPDSVRNLVRRAEQAMQQSGTFRKEVDRILRSLPKNENRV